MICQAADHTADIILVNDLEAVFGGVEASAVIDGPVIMNGVIG